MARVELPIVVLNDQAPYNPIAGASAVVLHRATSAQADVYTDAGATNTKAVQPLSTDSAGRLSGWLERGAYEIQITVPGKTPYSEYLDAAPGSDSSITTSWIADQAVTGAKISNTVKDAAGGTPSLRTLGTSSTQATAGNDARLSDQRTPKDGSVTEIKISENAVTTTKVKDGAVTDAKLASPIGPSWRQVAEGSAAFSQDKTAGLWILAHGGVIAETSNILGAGLSIVNLDQFGSSVPGKTTKIRVTAQLISNTVAPNTDFNIGLYQIYNVGGAADTLTLELTGPVTGPVTFNKPPSKSILTSASDEVVLSTFGPCVFAVSTSALLANNAAVYLGAQLQIRHV